jgi:hypothetical protein
MLAEVCYCSDFYLIPRVVEEATATPGVTHENPMGGFAD